jgi:formylglycine-generating enzyme required for sulfatase activity
MRTLLARAMLLSLLAQFAAALGAGCGLAANASSGLAAGDVFADRLRDGSRGPEMIVIPVGRFRMGDIQDKGYAFSKPVHEVAIPRPFAMGKYEVTFAEYDRFCLATGRRFPPDEGGGRGRKPVIHVSWNDAQAYVEWLSVQTGQRYRLPTEAEWEFAARAGTETVRYWGNDAEDACRFANVADLAAKEVFPGFKVHDCHDGFPFTAPAGSFQPNPFGLHDMLGNVWEWCEDTWHSSYKGAPTDGRAWIGVGEENRVRRGGSWFSIPKSLRSSARNGNPSGFRGNDTGFRVARDLENAELAR